MSTHVLNKTYEAKLVKNLIIFLHGGVKSKLFFLQLINLIEPLFLSHVKKIQLLIKHLLIRHGLCQNLSTLETITPTTAAII